MCFVALTPCTAQEQEQAERVRNFLEVEHSLSLDFVTSHTNWAKPYAKGPVRVLFFSPWFEASTEPREIIELLERFDLKAQAVYFQRGAGLVGDGQPDWYGGDPRPPRSRTRVRFAKPPSSPGDHSPSPRGTSCYCRAGKG